MLNMTAIGNLTRDPEATEKGARFTLACDCGKKDMVNYVTCHVYGKSAENAMKYLAKGHKVCVVGSCTCTITETDDNVYLNITVMADCVEYLAKPKEKKEEQTGEPTTRRSYHR